MAEKGSSQPTLSRFENGITGRELNRLWRAYERDHVDELGPKDDLVVLDIDGTDDPTHGDQQLSFFHGFYDQHMFHPLLVFDGERGQLVTGLLRPGRAPWPPMFLLSDRAKRLPVPTSRASSGCRVAASVSSNSK